VHHFGRVDGIIPRPEEILARVKELA